MLSTFVSTAVETLPPPRNPSPLSPFLQWEKANFLNSFLPLWIFTISYNSPCVYKCNPITASRVIQSFLIRTELRPEDKNLSENTNNIILTRGKKRKEIHTLGVHRAFRILHIGPMFVYVEHGNQIFQSGNIYHIRVGIIYVKKHAPKKKITNKLLNILLIIILNNCVKLFIFIKSVYNGTLHRRHFPHDESKTFLLLRTHFLPG